MEELERALEQAQREGMIVKRIEISPATFTALWLQMARACYSRGDIIGPMYRGVPVSERKDLKPGEIALVVKP